MVRVFQINKGDKLHGYHFTLSDNFDCTLKHCKILIMTFMTFVFFFPFLNSRYDFVLRADKKPDTYTMRFIGLFDCGKSEAMVVGRLHYMVTMEHISNWGFAVPGHCQSLRFNLHFPPNFINFFSKTHLFRFYWFFYSFYRKTCKIICSISRTIFWLGLGVD